MERSAAAPFIENFDSQSSFDFLWQDDSSQSPSSYVIEGESLKITTSVGSQDRVKAHTRRKDFGVGSYIWRIYIPQFEKNARCSIGAFLYHSGKPAYEVDFEIGFGKSALRETLNAEVDQAVVFCTSQSKPFTSEEFKVKMEAWSIFRMELNNVGGKYLVKWFINDQLVKTLQTEVKTAVKFSVYTSLENLSFMGSKWPTREHYALFDSFKYEQ